MICKRCNAFGRWRLWIGLINPCSDVMHPATWTSLPLLRVSMDSTNGSSTTSHCALDNILAFQTARPLFHHWMAKDATVRISPGMAPSNGPVAWHLSLWLLLGIIVFIVFPSEEVSPTRVVAVGGDIDVSFQLFEFESFDQICTAFNNYINIHIWMFTWLFVRCEMGT